MLLDVSYFTKGARRIQNASFNDRMKADSGAVNSVIDSYIENYQHRFLSAVVGEKEAGYIEDYLEIADSEGSESKYKEICDRLREPFADYVMFYILRDSNIQKTVTGSVKLKSANTSVSTIRAQVNVWNDMVGKNLDFIRWAREGRCPIDLVTETQMLNKINQFNI